MPRPEAFLAYEKYQIIRFNLGSNYMLKITNKWMVKKLMLLIERVYWRFLMGRLYETAALPLSYTGLSCLYCDVYD